MDTLIKVRSNPNISQNFFNTGTGASGTIYDILRQPDNTIILVGGFRSYNSYPVNGIVKLLSNGEVDKTFNLGYPSQLSSQLTNVAIARQSNGKLIVIGGFRVFRLNTDGTLDTSFLIGSFNGQYPFQDERIVIQSDGKIIITGAFNSYTADVTSSKRYIVRLNTDGTVDTTFNSAGVGFNTTIVWTCELQSDGKILLGTQFGSTFTYNGTSIISGVMRLNTDGTLDGTFSTNTTNNFSVYDIEVQSSGRILVSGFGNYRGLNRNLLRLNTNGTIDSSFQSYSFPSSSQIGDDIVTDSVGNIYLSSQISGELPSTTNFQSAILKFSSNGELNSSFNYYNLGNFIQINDIEVTSDDKLLVADTTNLFRLNSVGNIDNTIPDTNQYLDLYDDVSVNLNMSFAEIQDITSKNSGFSQSFRVPGTRDNNKFFNYMFDVNADNLTFNIQQSVPCSLSYKGETVLDGTLRLLKIYVNDKGVDYEVNIQDEVGLLINDISNKALYDLDFTDLNHTYNATSVQSSWNATYTGGTTAGGLKNGKILYGFSHNGYIYDKSGTTVTTGSNASPLLELSGLPGTISYSGTPMRTTGFKPSIQIYDLTKRIFEQNGYKLESDFFDTEYFQRLYMPLMFVADQYYINSTGATDGTSQIVLDTDRNPIGFDFSGGTCGSSSYQVIDVWAPLNVLVSNNGPTYPSSGWDLTQGTFYAWTGGQYKFDYKAKLSIPFGPQAAQGEVYLCKNLDTTVKYGSIAYTLDGSIVTENTYQNTDISITLAPGDRVNLVMRFTLAPVGCLGGQELIQPDFNRTETSVIVTDAPNLIVGSTIDIKEQFTPEYKQLDFLKGLMTQFNLVFVKHPYKTKTYIMEPFDDYVGQGKLLDWTDRLDLSKDVTISPITNMNGKAINFLYQDDADAMNTFTKSINNNRIFGTYNFIPEDTKINDQPLNITSFFSPTPCDTLPFADILPQPFIVPHLYGAKESTKEGVTNTQLLPMRLKPRILHYFGLQNLSTTWYFLNDVSGNTETKTTYPLIHHQNRIPSITELGTAIDLNFGNSSSPQDNVVPTTTTNTGYALYYEDYVNDLLSPDGRMVTGYFNLNVTDINSLEYKDLIFVKDTYYRINKIENFSLIENSLTKVELVKLLRVDLQYDCTIDATVELISGTPSGSCCLNPFTIPDITGGYVCDVRSNYTLIGKTVSITPFISGSTSTLTYKWNTPTTVTGSTSGGTANLTGTTAPFILGNIANLSSTESVVRYNITGSTADGFCSDEFYVDVIVSELPTLTSSTNPPGITGGTTFNYTITADNLVGGGIKWSRPAFGNNAASSGLTSTINETLVNSGTTTQYGVYTVTMSPAQGCPQTATVTVPVYGTSTGDTYNYYLVYRVEYPYSVKWTLSSSVGDDSPAYHVTVPFDIGNMVDNDIKYYVQYNYEPTELVGCYVLEMTSTNTCSHPSVIPGDSIVNVSNVSIEDPTFTNTGGSIWQKTDGGNTYNIIIVPAF